MTSRGDFDRATEDPGNIVAFEHVNTAIPDQRLATAYYISGLGLTRDPYLMTGIDNMWANIGRSQFHLPTGQPQVVRGVIGLVVPELAALVNGSSASKERSLARNSRSAPAMASSTRFRRGEIGSAAIRPMRVSAKSA